MSKQNNTNERNWYAVHTYSGYEYAVEKNIKQRIQSLDLNDKIFDVVVPVEKKYKVKGGKKTEVEEKIYPGYVLVDMIVDDDTWYFIRNTPRVTGFVGSGNIPVALTPKEVGYFLGKMQEQAPVHDVEFFVNDVVRISDGPFKDFEGKIDEIDKVKGRLRVLVNMFGRETPVELDFMQIARL